MIRSFAAAVVALSAPCLALAGPLATVDASFDPTLQNAYFIIDNTSGATETGVTLTTDFGPTTSVSLPDLTAGESYTYYFNQVNGGFLTGAGNNFLDDSTTYQLSVTAGGATLSSNVFSPVDNLTGAYVDFLGNTCFGTANCTVAQSGDVAEIAAAAVPEPAAPVAAIAPIALALILRRRAV